MNLVIDIGNTFTKLFLFSQGKVEYFRQFDTNIEIQFEELFDNRIKPERGIICTVKDLPSKLFEEARNLVGNLVVLDEKTRIPVKNCYKTPESLGKDRLAGIAGANNIFPSKNVLAIDAGTAITFDFINESSEYVGGNISPGLGMRFRALNTFTGKLPLIEKKESFGLLGSTTEEAIVSGVQNGIIFEINSYIETLVSHYNDLKVILTGGDCFFFAHKLKYPIFAEPFLVAIGLNRILEYNVGEN
ncbi:MAG: type III pantothenate kinase [Bacteroidales bacterium]